ncbi:threonine/serine dehydratase [Bradyrhizobium canariense]|uniref:threonine ammonia-lyase n=1 Tax=Bradyrhizobium canariense TaxID=255045 RepID=UPI001C667AEF|nr:threonine/serine dehydratase [Bradyrhizobium canariense]MBW5434067.1 threonine/serine dehydratase [Bradyrhizobium canariense]
MITIDTIGQAYARLRGKHVLTPLLEYEHINDLVGGRVLFKAENLQRTGSFKFRGAYNKIASLDDRQRARGVVTFSSGNHAQGVAAAAKSFNIPATAVMPDDAPVLKIQNTRRLGAQVILYDRRTGDRRAIAENITQETGAIMVPPFDDEMVIAGQGTIGIEITEQLEAVRAPADILLCPAGGGGLIAGVSTATRALTPTLDVYCVEPEEFDDTCRSLKRGERVANEPGRTSICDAIVTQMPGELTFQINHANLSGGFAVSDQQVGSAVNELFEMTKLVVEPGGAVGFAALRSGALALNGRTAVVILSGGNVDLVQFRKNFDMEMRN